VINVLLFIMTNMISNMFFPNLIVVFLRMFIVLQSILSPSFLPDDHQYAHSGTARYQQQHQLQHQFQQQLGPPGFATNGFIPSSSPTNVNAAISKAQFLDNRDHIRGGGGGGLVRTTHVHDRQTIGDSLVRPHSATPSFDSSLSVGLPPGLSSRQETPPLSNRSSGGGRRGSYKSSTATDMISGSDMYHLEDNTFEDRSQILQLGQRRSASTGVIGDIHRQGGSSSVLHSLGLGAGIAVRPAAKTLMDLIQEDYPKEPYGEHTSSIARHHGGGLLYDTTASGEAVTTSTVFQNQRDAAYALERPRTTSPLSSQYMREDYDYMYGRSTDNDLGYGGDGLQRSMESTPRGGNDANNNNNILDPMNRLNLGIGDTSSYRTNNNKVSQSGSRIFITADII
jgi:hypothetical protein